MSPSIGKVAAKLALCVGVSAHNANLEAGCWRAPVKRGFEDPRNNSRNCAQLRALKRGVEHKTWSRYAAAAASRAPPAVDAARAAAALARACSRVTVASSARTSASAAGVIERVVAPRP